MHALQHISRRYLPLLLGLVAVSSCKKLIQMPPNKPTQIASSQVFGDSVDVMSAIAGMYNAIGVSLGGQDFLNGGLTVYTGLTGDEVSYLGSSYYTDQSLNELGNNTISATDNLDLANMWTNPYTNLYDVNACLEGVSGSTGISAGLKQQLVGEIETVRALYYFNLVNLFGDVPLVTTTNYQVNAVLGRTPADSIYNQIIADLTDAKQKLVPAYPSAGRARPNLYTAMALLAKVYLYRSRWADAETACTQVLNSGLYSLVSDLNKVFLDGSTEAIWQLPPNSTQYQTSEPLAFIPYTSGVAPTYPITTYLQNAFAAADQRPGKWMGLAQVPTGNTVTSYYYPYKYKNTTLNAATKEDYMMLRLADLLLIRAEARARQNEMTDALGDVNLVRARAGLASLGMMSQGDLVDSVMSERQRELFSEWGNRWYDLKRTGVIDAVLGKEKNNWQPFDSLYPIPRNELISNPNLVQNPGY
jgi:hypothetical protein